MGDYLKIIIAVPIVTGLLGMMLPSGKLKKPTRLVVSLVALLAVLRPMQGLADIVMEGLGSEPSAEIDLPTFSEEGAATGEQMIVEETCRLISQQLESRVLELYGVENAKIELFCDTSDYQNVVIKSAVLRVGANGDTAYRERCNSAAKYVSETLGCKCSVEFIE